MKCSIPAPRRKPMTVLQAFTGPFVTYVVDKLAIKSVLNASVLFAVLADVSMPGRQVKTELNVTKVG